MSLETGYYFLYAFDADQRPLGAQQIPHIPNEQVVVDEHVTVPHKWHFEHVSGSKYIITFDSRLVENISGDVQVIMSPGVHIPFLWELERKEGVPPSSQNIYGISVAGAKNKYWFVPKVFDKFKFPVRISDVESSILIAPAE